MNQTQLQNLAYHQMHLLIQRGKYVNELKAIWKRRWKLEYPFWTDCTGEIKEMDR